MSADTAAKVEEAVQRAQSHLAAVGRDAALVVGDFTGDASPDAISFASPSAAEAQGSQLYRSLPAIRRP